MVCAPGGRFVPYGRMTVCAAERAGEEESDEEDGIRQEEARRESNNAASTSMQVHTRLKIKHMIPMEGRP